MNRKRVNIFTRTVCFVLATLMILGTFCTLVFGAELKYVDENGKTVKLNDFRDTKNHWAHDTILKWADYKMIVGNNANFMPNQPMKRGDVAVVLDRMMGLTTMSYNFFNDLSNDAYYRDAMLRNVAAGYFSGTSANTVNPLGNTTREEIAVILCRVFKIDTSHSGNTHFVDNNQISSWARPSVYALSKLGYMNGDGHRVNPKSYVTRAEIIQLFDNIAEVYIPKKDTTNQGSTFSVEAKRNFVTARNIELVRSNIGRDLIVTQGAKSIVLRYTNVLGRMIVLGNTNITLNNSKVEEIELFDKVTIAGITDAIGEIYVAEYATESTLDAIPERLILEPGVRVKIAGTMYENTTTRNKVYYGLEIKADIAAEQGFVIGGPKISGMKTEHTYDNNVVFKGIKIQLGDSSIDEVGIIYSEDADRVPTLSNYSKKTRYTKSYTAPFDMSIGKISGERTYRVYTIDDNGLISYSLPVTLKAYSFDIELGIFDLKYPETIRAEVLFNGYNIPEISSVKISHNTTSLYKEEINIVNASQKEVEGDENRSLLRYVAEIKSSYSLDSVTNEKVFDPPTEFGYIITFKDGSVVKIFPVLTNAVPTGIAPVDTLTTGNARFTTNNKLEVTNNYIRTRHINIQEAGVVYREVSRNTIMKTPEIGSSGWRTQSSYVNVGLKDTAYFNASLPIVSTKGETHFASYIKTANGYYYGKVKKVQNNWRGSETGPKIVGTPEILVLDSTHTVVRVPILINRTIDTEKLNSIISFVDSNGNEVPYYDGMNLSSADAFLPEKEGYMVLTFDKLAANKTYTVNLQLYDTVGDASNAISFTINTANLVSINLANRIETSNTLTYDVRLSGVNEPSKFTVSKGEILNTLGSVYVDKDSTPNKIILRDIPMGTSTAVVEFKYYIIKGGSFIKSVTFERVFEVQK